MTHVVRFTRDDPGMPVYLMSGGRDGAVRPWDEVPYRWMRRQSPDNPRVWLRLQA